MMKELQEIRKSIITYGFHFIKRWKTRDIRIDRVDETIKTGKPIYSRGRKIILKRYFGKDNETYCIVCLLRNNFIEAIKAWKKKGR